MYKARFESNHGEVFHFDFDHGVIFDIDPLSGIPVELSLSQGVGQVGQTVEAQTVEGISRTINGEIVGAEPNEIMSHMQAAFAPFASGKLFFNDDFFVDCFVQKTPYFLKEKSGRITFDLMVFCASPFWFASGRNSTRIGGYDAAFSFPVRYDTHRFSTFSENKLTTIVNGGNAESPFTAEFRTSGAVSSYGFEEVNTRKFLRINDTLEQGQVVTVTRDGSGTSGMITVVKRYSDGTEQNIFSALDEDSDFLSVPTGENVLKLLTAEGASAVECVIWFNEPFTGVHDGD